MTTTFTVDKSFAYIDRLTKHGSVFAACAGMHNRVILATRGASTVNITGVSDQLTAQPLDVVSDGTPSAYYVLTSKGITTLSAATNPAITAESVFDTGSNRWLFYSGGNLITPTAQGGVRLQTVGGTVLAALSGILCESTTAAFANGVLYIFCAKTGKMAVVTVTATALVFEGLFDAPNCREILRAVIDGTDLYCLNRNRVVRFSIATATSPTLAQDYGKSAVEFTDVAVVATGKLWFGFLTSTPGVTGPEFFGPLYGVWDSASQEIQTAAPRMSAWMVNNVIPYYTSATIPTITPTPPPAPVVPPYVPPVIAPLPPVITSSLTTSVTEDTAFAYTITATGAGPITYSVLSPPSWLTSIDALTGAISGVPADPGTVNVTIRATNAGGSDTETLVVTVAPALASLASVSVNGSVNWIEVVGSVAYLMGEFTAVTDASGTITRNRMAAIDLITGLWTSWNPAPNGSQSMACKLWNGWMYVGGDFTTVGGQSKNVLARVNLTTGAADPSWTYNSNGSVSSMCSADKLYICCSASLVNGSGAGVGPDGVLAFNASGVLTSWEIRSNTGVGVADSNGTTARDIVAIGGVMYSVGGGRIGSSPTAGREIFSSSQSSGNAVETQNGKEFNAGYLGNGSPSAISSNLVAGAPITGGWAITAAATTGDYTRGPLIKITSDCGLNLSYNPTVNGGVRRIVSRDSSDYVGGDFTTVNGATRRLLVRLDSSGSTMTEFAPNITVATRVLAIARYTAYVLVGVSLNPATVGGVSKGFFFAVHQDTGALY